MKKASIYLNGSLIGFHEKPKEFVQSVREKRRKGEITSTLTIAYYSDLNEVYINTDTGRALRPLIVVENGKSKLTKEHVKLIKSKKMKFSDLVKNGIIEFLDAEEEENAYIAFDENELTKEHTHLEIHPSLMLGAVAALSPFPEYNSSPRITMSTQMLKQSIGLYASNFNVRTDTLSHVLYYPQTPIVRTDYNEIFNADKRAAGQNFVIALISYKGYNINDAIVLNKSSVERGLGRSVYYKTYNSEERRYPGGQKDRFELIKQETPGYRGEDAYKKLDEDGIVEPELEVQAGEVIIGKTSPPRFLEETSEIGLLEEKRRENSTVVKEGDEGVVDYVVMTEEKGGTRLTRVKMRRIMIPEIGDKFAARYGQKGVVGLLVKNEDMPFSENGLIPDMCMNPHAIPGRMTAGYLLETIGAKAGSLKGKRINATAFDGDNVEELKEVLKEYGFKPSGKEVLYDGVTGKRIEAEIFVGVVYYERLKHLVSMKIHARARGPVQILTRQPTEGRAREGGLRFGEMERDCLIGHGTAMLLMERLLEESDKVTELICSNCGMIAMEDKIRNKKYCPVCGSNDVYEVKMSYAFKLLLNEIKAMGVYPKLVLEDKV